MLKENVVDMTDPDMFKDTMSIWLVQGKTAQLETRKHDALNTKTSDD